MDSSELSLTTEGVLSFISAPDYEVQTDYTATVLVTDGINTVSQDITVLVTNVDDVAPVFTSSDSFSVAENQTLVGIISATDVDTEDASIIFSVEDDAFTISSE